MREQIPQAKNEQVKERLYETARTKINVLFDSHGTGRERVDALRSEIDAAEFLENKEAMKIELETCIDIKTKKEFIDAVFRIIKPIVDLRLEKPELFVRENEITREFMRLNEVLSYEIRGNTIDVHMLPEERAEHFLTKSKAGLQKLAKIVDENKNIDTIEITSWIIAEHPELIERFGFVIDGEISEAIRKTDFSEEERKIFKAHVARNDFLKKYLS